ncbi:hypothetical protein C8R45DRAFT_1073654 [Mycena sanguinolenta]|nr:hypothetical protein C8R45DRAFT_1073654 [Mycena sanguinolenta]
MTVRIKCCFARLSKLPDGRKAIKIHLYPTLHIAASRTACLTTRARGSSPWKERPATLRPDLDVWQSEGVASPNRYWRSIQPSACPALRAGGCCLTARTLGLERRCRTTWNMMGKRPRHEEMDICRLQKWLLEVAPARWQRGPVHRDGGGREEEGRVGFTERDVSDLVETDAMCRFFHRVSDLKKRSTGPSKSGIETQIYLRDSLNNCGKIEE